MPKAKDKKYTKSKKVHKLGIAKPDRRPSKPAVTKARDRELYTAMGVTTRSAARRASTEGGMSEAQSSAQADGSDDMKMDHDRSSTSENTSKSNNTVEMKSIGSGGHSADSDPLSPMGSPPPDSSSVAPPETSGTSDNALPGPSSLASPEQFDNAPPGTSRVPSPHPSGSSGFARPAASSSKHRGGVGAARAGQQGPSSVDPSIFHAESSSEAMVISSSTEGENESESGSGSSKDGETRADILCEVDESGSDPDPAEGGDDASGNSNSSEGADSLPEHEESRDSVTDAVQHLVEEQRELEIPEGEPTTSGYHLSPAAERLSKTVIDPAKTPPRETSVPIPAGLWSPTRSRLRGPGGQARRSDEERASSHRVEPYISPKKIHHAPGTPPKVHHTSSQKPHAGRRFSVVEGSSPHAPASFASFIERSSSSPGLQVLRLPELQAPEPRERRASEPDFGAGNLPRPQKSSTVVQSRRPSSRSEGAKSVPGPMEVDVAVEHPAEEQRQIRTPGGERSTSRDRLDDVAEKLARAGIDSTTAASPVKIARKSEEDSPARRSRLRGHGGQGYSPGKHRRESEEEGTSTHRTEPYSSPKKSSGTPPKVHRISPRGHCLTRRSTGVEAALSGVAGGISSSGTRSRSSLRVQEARGSEPRASELRPLERLGLEPQGVAESAPRLQRSSPTVSRRQSRPAPESAMIPDIVVSPPDEEPEGTS